MKEGWEYKTLGEVAKVFAGGDVPKNRMSKCKKEPFIIPIYTNGIENEGLYGYTDIARVNDLSLTISARGTIGAIFKRNNPFFPAIRLITVCPQNIVDINFLYYVLLNSTFTKSGTTIPQLTVPMLKQYRFAIPENISIQQNIANYLDSSFKLIDEIKNKALKSLTEAKALFQSALAEAMEPKEGWEYIELSKKCKVQNGFAFNSKDFNCINGLPLIRIRDIKRGFSETYTNEYCSSDYIVENGDLLVGMDGDFNVGIWKGGHALLNQRVCMIKPLNNYNIKFLYYYLPNILNRINQKTSFSTVKHLSSKQVNKINIPDIILDEQSQIVSHLDSLSSKVRAIEEKYQKMVEECDALKQAMLRDVFE